MNKKSLAKVKVLINGYTTADSKEADEEKTCATITLIKDGKLVMVIDSGVLESRKMLIDALKKEKLSLEDVNVVGLTHSHIDHYASVGMFPNAKILEFYGLWDKNKCDEWNEQFTDNIKIIKSLGHDKTGITFLVKTNKGIMAVCGDVFWKEDYPKNDPYADNPKKLKETRKNILKLADWIVPGHAGMYRVLH